MIGPRHISNMGLPNSLKNMDSVFVWGRNQKTYFVKGNQYWRYNERRRAMDAGYPRSLSVWKGIPANLDGVMKWKNGKTYFFKGKQYYKLDDYSIAAEASYPQSIAIKWMRCETSRLVVKTATVNPTGNNTFVKGNNDKSSGTAVLPTLVMLIGALTAGKLF